ncbi:alpha/beta fold hydrolase [Nocardioides sp. GY 10113]|uniref:alpha/beta fold hydrolase n=1 Tax=Nocardioides sp. GY 10113 TaxID=2569761 RepID=UPI0010A8F485|nr:alpha/beta fold hydrolase [Nocardioides sp. GY 10113]TIC88109.1 alpha/beta fold hydrolase [Nocardioides sp. GY 10113]
MGDVVLILADGLELDETLFELRRDGRAVPLEPQAFDVLLHLVRHRDRVVPKEELMEAVWGGRFVSESAVTSRIKQVRRALGDDGRTQGLVRTQHGRGYRYVGPVGEAPPRDVPTTPVRAAAPAAPPAARPRPPVRYTVSDGLQIAHQVTGGGPLDLVLIPGFISHLDLDWDDPRHAHFLDRLGGFGRLIRFDKRGTGMSDRPSGVPDLETRMHDVLAVMKAVDSDRAVLVGYSEGVPMSLLMAALHPERVRGLVLYGGASCRTWRPDYPWAKRPEERRAYTDHLVATWDWAGDIRYRCPDGADEAMQRWWERRMGAAATPSTVRALIEMNSTIDVRHVLPSIAAPTLVLHRSGDELFDPAEAAYIADRVPGAELRFLEGRDHVPWGDADQILDVVESFLASIPEPSGERALAAVVAVAGSGADAVVAALTASGGRPRRRTDGAPVLLFDGPATAIRAVRRAVAGGVAPGVAVGVAIDEVAVDDGPVSSAGVDEAVTLAAGAPPGCILADATAAVLLAGSGITVETGGSGARVVGA